MSRAVQTARRKARKAKSANDLRTMPARQTRRQRRQAAAEEARLTKLRECPYHDMGSDLKAGDILYKEGVDQPLIHIKWQNISLLICLACGSEWPFYFVKQHP